MTNPTLDTPTQEDREAPAPVGSLQAMLGATNEEVALVKQEFGEGAIGAHLSGFMFAMRHRLASTAKAQARIDELEAGLREIAHETRRQQLPITSLIHEIAHRLLSPISEGE